MKYSCIDDEAKPIAITKQYPSNMIASEGCFGLSGPSGFEKILCWIFIYPICAK